MTFKINLGGGSKIDPIGDLFNTLFKSRFKEKNSNTLLNLNKDKFLKQRKLLNQFPVSNHPILMRGIEEKK